MDKMKECAEQDQTQVEMEALLECLLEQVKGSRFGVAEWALEQASIFVRGEKEDKAAGLEADCEAALKCVRG